jgi:predicted GNAT family acetyltransferase
MDLQITDVPAAQRYEAHRDGALVGFLEYVVKRGRIALVHTEVPPEHEGQGIAGVLARFALEDARRRALRVIPICPYVRTFLERHPEYADLVASGPGR